MIEELEKIFTDNISSSSVDSIAVIALNLVIAMILGVVVAKVYKRVHKGISYSESYAYSIVLVTMIVTFVMMVIGGNLTRAFTLLGAFTIIRYRTAVKDPKDTAFIFLALVLGLAVGGSNYAMAITGTFIISITALLLDKLNFGSMIKLEQVLYLTIESKSINQEALESILKKHFKKVSIINVNYNSATESLQYSYNVKLFSQDEQSDAIQAIAKIKGVKDAEILASQQVVEF